MEDTVLKGTLDLCSAQMVADLHQEAEQLVASLKHLARGQLQVIRELREVCLDLTEEKAHRDAIIRLTQKLEREAQHIKLPLWFWRPEKDEKFCVILQVRANYLAKEGYASDDIWTLLHEFAQDYAHEPLSDGTAKQAIEIAYRMQQ
jgi:uncharacterized protein YigA (DUF484 family)